MDRAHHRAVWLRHRARVDLARRPEGDAAAGSRHGAGEAGRFPPGRTSRAGKGGTTRRVMAGADDGESGAAVSSRSRSRLDGEELGPDPDPQAVQPCRTCRRRADRSSARRDRRAARAGAAKPGVDSPAPGTQSAGHPRSFGSFGSFGPFGPFGPFEGSNDLNDPNAPNAPNDPNEFRGPGPRSRRGNGRVRSTTRGSARTTVHP